MYTVDYFIEKFEKIPHEMWCVTLLEDANGRHCAWGHLGVQYMAHCNQTHEGKAFGLLFYDNLISVFQVNDGRHSMFQQDNPKDRMLAALHYIKSLQAPAETPGTAAIEDFISEPVLA